MTGETPQQGAATQTTGTATEGIVGGPHEQQQQQQNAFKFKFGNREFSTEKDLEDYISGLGTRITELEARPVQQQQTQTQAPSPRNDGNKGLGEMTNEELVAELLGNPKGVLQAIREDTRNEIVSREQSKANIEGMWNGFWDKNKELKKYESVVKMVFDANLSTLGPMKMADVPIKLAELSRGAILAVNKDAFTSGNKQSNSDGHRTIVEGGENVTLTREQPPESAKQPGSLTAAIKKRAEARRKSQAA